MKPNKTIRTLLLALAASSALLGSAHAATWSGAGTDGKWSNAANWDGGAVPYDGDQLLFAKTNRLGGTNDFVGYNFQSIEISTNGFRIGGNPFNLSGGIVNYQNNTISNRITLAAQQTFRSAVANTTLTLEGNITNGGYDLDHQGPGMFTYNGVISGAGGVTFTGSGGQPANITFANSNSYAGDTHVYGGSATGGRIALTTTSARVGKGVLYLETDGSSPINQGGQLYIQAGVLTNDIVAGGIGCLESAGHLGAIRFQNGSVSNVTLTANTRIMAYSSGNTGTVFGVLAGLNGTSYNLDVNVNDSGKTVPVGLVTLYTNNSAIGTVTIGGGTLVVRAAGGLGGSPMVFLNNATLNVLTATNLFIPALVLPSFTGNGTIQGSVAFASGSSVSVGAIGTAASLFVTGTGTGLTLNDAVKLNFDFSTNAAAIGAPNDLISVSNLTVNGTITVNPNFIGTASPTLNQPYTMIKYNGTYSGSGNFVLATGYGYTVNTAGGAVTVTFTSATARNLTWNGNYPGDWDVNLTENWKLLPGGGAAKFYTRDNVTFDDSGPYTTMNLPASLTPGNMTFNNNVDYTLGDTAGGMGALMGGSPLVKNGAGNLLINATNVAYDGTITINQGTVSAGNASALGSTNGATLVKSGGVLNVNAFNLGAEPVIVSGAGSGMGAIVNNGPGQQQNALRYVTLAGDATFGGSQRWDIRSTSGINSALSTSNQPYNLTVAMDTSVIVNPSFSLVGVLVDTNLGNIDVQSGIFSFETTSTSLGNPAANLVVQSGATFQLYQTTNYVDKVITFKDNSTLFNNNAGNTIVGPITLESGTAYVNGGGTYVRLFGPITGSGAMFKYGGGGLYINGTNSSTGGLTVTNGAIGGAGYITGAPVYVTNSTVSPGTNGVGTPGTLTITTDLTLLTNASLTFDFTNNANVGGGNDLISLSDGTTQGTLTLDGPITINANPMAGNLVAGTYTLITNGSATVIPNAASFLVGNGLPLDGRYGTPTFDASIPGTLLMTIPTAGDKLIWKGLYSAVWDTDATSISWSNTLSHIDGDIFYNSDSVLFDDTAAAFSVSVGSTVLPSSFVMANNVNNYYISSGGAGKISGGTSLVQTGAGTNFIGLANDYTSGTFIRAGMLQMGNASALGNPQGTAPFAVVTNSTAKGATLDINGLDLSGRIPTLFLAGPGVSTTAGSMAGALINSATTGSGNGVRNVTLTGNTSIGQDGGLRLDIRNGVLDGGGFKLTKVGNNFTSLQGTGRITNLVELIVNGGVLESQAQVGPLATVNAGATFQSYNSPPLTNAFVLNGGRLFTGAGTFMTLGPITLNAGSNSFDGVIIVSNKISGPGLLSKLGANVLTLAANNDWTGGLLLPTGTLNIGNGMGAGSAGTGTVTNNGVLQFNHTNAFTWVNNVTGSGTWLKINTNTMTVTGSNYTSSAANPAINIVGTVIVGPGAYLGTTNNVEFRTGNWTNGNLIVNGGTIQGGGWMQVGRNSGAPTNTVSVGTLTLNSGTVIHGAGNFLAAGDSGAMGTITVNGGVISNLTTLIVGDTAMGRGYLNLNGGRVQALQIAPRNPPVAASVATFNGGIVEAIASQANFLAVSNALVSTNGLIFDTGATNVVAITMPLMAFTNLPASAPNAGLVKIGDSSLTLSSVVPSTYPGNTVVSNGTLALDTYLSGRGTAVVSAGATLVGTGTNAGPLTVNGILAPGGLTPSAGTLTVSNAVFAAGATNKVDLSSPNTTPGQGINDLLVVNGNLDLTSPSKVVFNFLNGVPVTGSPYTLITYSGALSGTTANLQPVIADPTITVFITNTANAIIATFATSNPRAATNLVWTGDGTNNLWSLASAGYWLTTPGGLPEVFYTMDNVLFDDTTPNRIVNLVGTVSPAAVVVNTATNYMFTNTGSISGPARLTKQGPGTLALGSTNSYGGGTLVSAGILQLGSNVANLGIPSGGPICEVAAGAGLDLNAVNISVVPNYLHIAGAYSSNVGAVFSSRALPNGQGFKNLKLTADASIGNSTARIDSNGGILDGGGYNLTKIGTQTLSLWYAGGRATNLASVIVGPNGGTFELGNGGWFALNCPVVVNSNSTFNFYNLNANFTNTPVTLSYGTWNNTGGNGTNAGTVTLATGTTNYVTCSGGTSLNFLGPIVGAGNLVKNNTSALPVRLLTNNTYTGATIVNQGTLILGANGSISNSPIITVSSNAIFDVSSVTNGFKMAAGQALAGSGSVLGAVTGGSVLLQPGGLNTVGTLNLQNHLTVGAGTTLYVDLTNTVTEGSGVNDLLLVSGNASFTSPVTLNVSLLAAPPAVGVPYTIVRSAGTLTANTAGWTVTGTRYPATVTSDAQTIQITFTDLPPGSSSLVWQGDTAQNTNWAIGVTGWLNTSGPTVFYNSDSVLFDDTAVNLTANVAAPVYPGAVSVNSTKNYTFAGPGRISGSTSLTKAGTGVLTLANTGGNSYTGPTIVAGGTLKIGSAANPVPATSGVVLSNTAGATLDLNNQNLTIGALDGGGDSGGNVTLGTGALSINGGGLYGGVISGNGQLVKSGAGTVTLSGASTYAGGTVLNAGTIVLVNSTGYGTGPGSVLIGAGSTLRIGTNSTGGSIAAQPGGVLTNNGTFALNRSDLVVINDQITGTGSIQQNGAGTSYLNRAISGSGSINQTAGTIYLTASNSFNGAVTLNGVTNNAPAVMVISNSYALGTTNGTTTINGNLNGNSILQLAGNITVPEIFILSARQGTTVNIPHIESTSGTNTLTGALPATTGGSDYNLQADAGSKLIVAGTFNPPSAGGTRILKLQGDGTGDWTGIIANGTDTTTLANVTKIGPGIWTLSGTNTYTGVTTVSNGNLRVNGVIRSSAVNVMGGGLSGTGLITSPVTIAADALLTPGAPTGTLTISNTLTLAAGSAALFEIDKTAGTYDCVRGLSTVTFGGSLLIGVVPSAPLAGGDSFKLFDATTYVGSFSEIIPAVPGAGLEWDTNSLPVDGTLKVVSKGAPGITAVKLLPDGNVSLTLNGNIGQAYSVHVSTNVLKALANWTVLSSGTIPSVPFVYNDLTATNFPQRFYIISSP